MSPVSLRSAPGYWCSQAGCKCHKKWKSRSSSTPTPVRRLHPPPISIKCVPSRTLYKAVVDAGYHSHRRVLNCGSQICTTSHRITSVSHTLEKKGIHNAKQKRAHDYTGTDDVRTIRNLRTRFVTALTPKLHFRKNFGIRRTGERTFSNDNSQNIQVTASDSRLRVEPFVFISPTSASRCCASTVSGWGAAPGGGAFRAAYARSRAACMMLAVVAYQ